IAGIDGIEGISGSGTEIDVRLGFQMIGIGSKTVAPALLKNTPERVVHHLLRGAPRARVLAHRLLREDGSHVRVADCANVARSGQSQPIAASRRFLKNKPARNTRGQERSKSSPVS